MRAKNRRYFPQWLFMMVAVSAVCVLVWRGISVGAGDPAFMAAVLALIMSFPALLRDLRPPTPEPPPLTFTRKDYADLQFAQLQQYERDYVMLPLQEWQPPQDGTPAREWLARAKPYRAIDMVPHAKFVLVGNPGAGKSTLLRWLTRHKLRDFRDGRIPHLPFWIDLSLESNPDDPRDLIAAWWTWHCLTDDLEAQLVNGGLLLLLDGLNEMPGDRDVRADKLRTFLRTYPGPAIVTCREADYRDKLRIGDGTRIREVSIPALTKDNVIAFAKKSLGDKEKVDTFIDKVYGEASTPERRALAGNALALTMLLKLFEGPSDVFPDTREALYDGYIREMFDRNQTDKPRFARVRTGYDSLTRVLQQLAYSMLVEGKGNTVERRWAYIHVSPWRAWWLARIGLMNRHDFELQEQQQTLRTLGSSRHKARLTRLDKIRTTAQMAQFDAKMGLVKWIVERIVWRRGRRIIRDAVNLHLIVEDRQLHTVRFFHPSLYEHLALRMIDLTHGSTESRTMLMKRLDKLGGIARPALSKIVEVYLSEVNAPEMTLLAAALAAQTTIAYHAAMNADSHARDVAFRLMVACWVERILWVVNLTYSDHTITIAHNLAMGLSISLDRARSRALRHSNALANLLAITLARARTLAFANLTLAISAEIDFDAHPIHRLNSRLDDAMRLSHTGTLDHSHTLAFMRELLETFAPSLDLDADAALSDANAAHTQVCAIIRQAAAALSQMDTLS